MYLLHDKASWKGKIIVIIIISAEAFNVKKIVPAYLDPNVQLEDLLTGVTFASGGAGYDPQTSNLVVCIMYGYKLYFNILTNTYD